MEGLTSVQEVWMHTVGGLVGKELWILKIIITIVAIVIMGNLFTISTADPPNTVDYTYMTPNINHMIAALVMETIK